MTGHDVKEFRNKMKMNQTDFGKFLGYKHPQTQISAIEHSVEVSDRLKMTLRMWEKLVSMENLMFENDERGKNAAEELNND